MLECVDIYDVYYNTSTGAILKEVCIGRECSGNEPSSGGGEGGGTGGGTGAGGPTGTGSGNGASQSIYSQLPPCANTVLNNLLASAVQNGAAENLLDAVLTALQMPNSTLSVHFVADNTLAANVAGDCRYNSSASYSTGVNDFTIRLNTAYLNGGQPTYLLHKRFYMKRCMQH